MEEMGADPHLRAGAGKEGYLRRIFIDRSLYYAIIDYSLY